MSDVAQTINSASNQYYDKCHCVSVRNKAVRGSDDLKV